MIGENQVNLYTLYEGRRGRLGIDAVALTRGRLGTRLGPMTIPPVRADTLA